MSLYDRRNSGICTIRTFRNLTRYQTTLPWKDHPAGGTLYQLIQYGTRFPLAEFDIQDAIGWKKRTVQNQITQILLKSALKPSITMGHIKRKNKKIRVWSLDSKYHGANFDHVHELMLNSHYLSKYGHGMTSPEVVTQKLLTEIFDEYEWKFTGKTILPNRIGNCYPDFRHKKFPFLIEVFGDYWHGRLITGKDPERHEREKIEYYESINYNCLVIWEKELKNLEKVKLKILQYYDDCMNNVKKIKVA